MWIPLITGIICGTAGLISWYIDSPSKFFGMLSWKVNSTIGVINLLIAAFIYFSPVAVSYLLP